MRRIAFALLLAALGLPSIPPSATAGEEVPFRGSISIIDEHPTKVTIGGVTYTAEVATGTATHLGRLSGPIYYSPPDFTIDPVVGPELLFYGFGILTAANGDQLWFVFDDAYVLLTTNADGNYPTGFTATIVGGTGRFTNAGGELDFTGYVLPQGADFGPTYFEVSGSITTVGSGK